MHQWQGAAPERDYFAFRVKDVTSYGVWKLGLLTTSRSRAETRTE